MRRNKYGNRRVEIDGYTFDSQAEAARYAELRLLDRAGEIMCLEIHPRFVLLDAFRDAQGRHHKAITYSADFRYRENGTMVVEDVKARNGATQTQLFRTKWKLVIKLFPDTRFEIVTR